MSIADLLQRAVPSYVIVTPWQRPVPPHKTTMPHHEEMPDTGLPYYHGVIEIGISDLPRDWEKRYVFTMRPDSEEDQVVILRERKGNSIIEMVNSQYKSGPFLVNKFWQVMGQHALGSEIVVDAPSPARDILQLDNIARGTGDVSIAQGKSNSIRKSFVGQKFAIEDLAHYLVTFLDQNHQRILDGMR